jgi:hypothetical protein
MSSIDSIEDAPFWHDVDLGDPVEVFREPSSVLQHSKTSSAQHINKTARTWVDGGAETEDDSSDNSRLGVEVLIDRTDRSRKMFTEPTRVRPTPCTALKTSLTSIWLAAQNPTHRLTMQPTLRLQLNQNEAIDRRTSFRVLGLTI